MIKLIKRDSLVLGCALLVGILATTMVLAAKTDKPTKLKLNVDCSVGETIQASVDVAVPGDIIEVTGICNENVVIETDRITLDGGGTAEIKGVDPSFFVGTITVNGVTNVTIRSFAMITGSSIGVRVDNSGHAIIGGETVGEGNNISDNAHSGVLVFLSSSAFIGNNILSNNGVPAAGGSGGINVNANSSTEIISNTITGAGQAGVSVFGNSHAFLLDNLISGSQLAGVSVLASSSINIFESPLRPGLGPNRIINNQAFGLICQVGGSIFMLQDVDGVLDVLLTAFENPVGNLVHSPSCAVFPGNTGIVIVEIPDLP